MLLLTEECWADAEAYFDCAGRLFGTVRDTFSQALARNSAGEAARRGRRYKDAMGHYEAFLAAMEGFGSDQGIGVAHLNLGWVKVDASLYAGALEHFELAVERLREAAAAYLLTARVGLGETQARLGNVDLAEETIRAVVVALDGGNLEDTDARESIQRLRVFAEKEGLTTLWSLSRRAVPPTRG